MVTHRVRAGEQVLQTLACSKKSFSDQLEKSFLARLLPIVLVRCHLVHGRVIYSKRDEAYQICICYEIITLGRTNCRTKN